MNQKYNLIQTIINNNLVGNINITFDIEKLRIKSIYITDKTFDNISLVNNKLLKEHFLLVYTFLKNYGKKKNIIDNLLEYMDLSGYTEFYRNIYKTLYNIPFGDTITYGELAKKVGTPKAARAVGTAMSKNQFLIIIPCHRVVGKNYLGNFTGGVDIKKRLLRIEGYKDF